MKEILKIISLNKIEFVKIYFYLTPTPKTIFFAYIWNNKKYNY